MGPVALQVRKPPGWPKMGTFSLCLSGGWTEGLRAFYRTRTQGRDGTC